MKYNYHTHTYRCGHAVGTIEEYILRSISCGVTHLGFSDHFPHICTEGYESNYRIPFKEGKKYFAEINSLREKYKNQIDIKIGFEMEYYPQCFQNMLKNAIDFGAEYLILGEHYTKEENTDSLHTITPTDSIEDLKEYVATVVEGIYSGVFTYIAHPDLINFKGDNNIYEAEMRKICIAARESEIPLEINFLGIRDNRNYPNESFWKIAGEEKSPVTFGFDAHDIKNAYDGDSLIKAKEMVDKYKLNYIGKPKINKLLDRVENYYND